MSTSRAIKPKRDDTLLSNWESQPERAPSILRDEPPTVARILAMFGLFLVVLGTLAMLAPQWQRATIISPGVGFFFASIGVSLILFHAFAERDFQFRRLYGVVGLGLLACGVFLRLLAFKGGNVLTWPAPLSGAETFFFFAAPALLIGLILVIAVSRNETDAYFRSLLVNLVGGLGGVMIVFSMFNGLNDSNHMYLPGEGAALLILGLLFACAYIAMQPAYGDRGYYAGLALGAIGVVGFFGGLFRSLGAESTFLVPSGIILMGISLVYIVLSIAICFDWPIIVQARRDLAAYFFSPVAYLVFIGQLLFGWLMFWLFVTGLRSGQMYEPIVGAYIFSIFPVIVQMFLVPALTMRLLSEERKTGTLEVLLTAPINEISIVVGKFLASWIFYMILWLPWWLFLVSLRYVGGEEFDYRPILSFTVALCAIGAGFVSMGLFFSSLTSNQIIAAVFTFVGMMTHLGFYFGEYQLAQPGSTLAQVLGFVNYFDFWIESLEGTLSPRLLIFHVCVAIFFLFATVKVLESRKWK